MTVQDHERLSTGESREAHGADALLQPGLLGEARQRDVRLGRGQCPRSHEEGLDYVLVSYYEDDCNGFSPTGRRCSRARDDVPGLGSASASAARRIDAKKAEYVQRYYGSDL